MTQADALPPFPWEGETLLAFLPHREPFLFIDKVYNVEPSNRLTGSWRVPETAEFFKGHFPAMPRTPGVILLESMAQAAVVLAFASAPEKRGDAGLHLMAINNAKFRRAVLPGETVELTVWVDKIRRKVWRVRGKVEVGGEEAAGAQFLARFLE